MLDLTNLIGFGVSAERRVELTEPVLTNLAGTSVLTFPAANLGNPFPDRVILVNVVANRTVNGTVTVSCTVGGVAMTQRLLYIEGGKYHAIFTGEVPSGTTGDIVLTFGSGAFMAFASVLAATGGINVVPHSILTNKSTEASLSLSVPEDGVMLCSHNTNNSLADASWSGATKLYGAAFGANSGSITADLRMAAEIGRVIAITASGTSESAAGATFGWN